MNGSEIIATLKKRFKAKDNQELARCMGIETAAIQKWKSSKKISENRWLGAIKTANEAGSKTALAHALNPVVEFFHIDKTTSKGGAKYEIFSISDEQGKEHPYLAKVDPFVKTENWRE